MKKRKNYYSLSVNLPSKQPKRTVRKDLNADAMLKLAMKEFRGVKDPRGSNSKIPISDALMSALAMFHLKDQSLLAFDNRRQEEPENLHSVYGIGQIPCDSQMRTILDNIELSTLRPAYRAIFKKLQRGKNLENMTYLGDHYLVSADGSGYYSSSKVSSPYCMRKVTRKGEVKYYQQMYAAAMVHPDLKEVIPFFPEIITKQDGRTKNDCERNASRRFWQGFRQDHPHLKVIALEDGLGSNAPHIRDLQELNIRYILGAKEGDHKYLFAHIDQAAQQGSLHEFSSQDNNDPDTFHNFRFVNQVSLNSSNKDLLVNFLEYWQTNQDGEVIYHFSWVTDIKITLENAFAIMRAGRSRWRIENETFNTLKNQGYNLGHNYGLGKKNLSAVFTILMMLAFLIDQACQMSCWLFKAAWEKVGAKRYLWERIRGIFHQFDVDSMETIYRAVAFGFERVRIVNPLKT